MSGSPLRDNDDLEKEGQPLLAAERGENMPTGHGTLMKVSIEDPRIRPPSRTSSVPPILTTCFSHKTAKVVLAVLVASSWMFVSNLLILVNKYILKDIKFPYPIIVGSMGMFASSCFSYTVCRVLKLSEAKAQISWKFWVTRMMPVGVLMALTLWTGNLVYLYLSVSFIQMLKSFTPVMTMLAAFLAGMETPTKRLVGSVLCIAGGIALATYGEVHLNLMGLCIMFVSEAAEAGKLVMTQVLLQGLKMGPFEGLMYLAPACFAWLMLAAVFLEIPQMMAAKAHLIPLQYPGLFLLAACMGFAVNTLAYATIKLTGSLTLKVLGTVKNALLILTAVVLYSEVVTGLQGLGYTISTIAFGMYTAIKMKQVADS